MKSNDLEFENPPDNRRKIGRLYRREMTNKKDHELKKYVMSHLSSICRVVRFRDYKWETCCNKSPQVSKVIKTSKKVKANF